MSVLVIFPTFLLYIHFLKRLTIPGYTLYTLTLNFKCLNFREVIENMIHNEISFSPFFSSICHSL